VYFVYFVVEEAGKKSRRGDRSLSALSVSYPEWIQPTKEDVMAQVKAAVMVAPGKIELRTFPKPKGTEDALWMRVDQVGLCGSDQHMYLGHSKLNFPVIPGHEVVGTVVEVGRDVSNVEPGSRVTFDPNIPCGECYFCRRMRFNHCLNWQGIGITRGGGFAEKVAVPGKVIYPVADMPFERAVFAEPLACVVYGVLRAEPKPGDMVLLFGAGPVGLLLLQVLKVAGAASVTVVEVMEDRLRLAEVLGADRTVQAGHEEALREEAPLGYDIVVDATGVPEVVSRCADLVIPGGKVLLFGVCPEGATVSLSPFQIYRRDITILGSFALNYTMDRALGLLSSGSVRVEPMISHRFPLEKFPEALELVGSDEPSLKVLVRP